MPDTLIPLLLVLAAAILDVLANLLLARSEGFRRRLPGILALLGVGLAFYCLSLAVRTLDLSVAYAMWGEFRHFWALPWAAGSSSGSGSGPAPLPASPCS